jgi:hypothetical protein
MKPSIVMVDLRKLVGHERVDRGRLMAVRTQLCTQRALRRPIIVDRGSHVILDGHHRVSALRTLGAKRIPVQYVQYQSKAVRVYFRRRHLLMRLIKQCVLENARRGNVFPSKTTRHLLQHRRRMRAIPLSTLI